MTAFTPLCTSIFVGAVFISRGVASHSTQFLRPREAVVIEGMSANEARQLNAEIESLFGRSATQASVTKYEDALRPIFVTLSSNGKHGLGHAATRYALHRYFQQRHGWRVNGIDMKGNAWNASSATEFLQGKVPDYVQQIFDDRLNLDALDLRGVAVLAATVEHIVRIETVSRLERSYEALGMFIDDELSLNDVDNLMDMYMLLAFFGTQVPLRQMKHVRRMAPSVYPGWEDTQMFLRDLNLNRAYANRDTTNPFVHSQPHFDNMLHVIEEVNDKHGRFQNQECQALKQILLTVEHKGTGRVRLSDFYGLGASGHPQFVERQEYLRDLGVLDETDETAPSVMISNWLYSETNCLGSSVHYSICCVNECNSLMAHLEQQFRNPRVPADQLAAAVTQLSSSTVAAPRNLSTTMMRRLKEIAEIHKGAVLLHGRLFAQWMHHAFPRECQYPNVAGTALSLSPTDWRATTGFKTAFLNASELKGVAKIPDDAALQDEDAGFDELSWVMDEETEQQARWEDDEEVFIVPGGEETMAVPNVLRTMAMFAAVISIVAVLIQSVLAAHASTPHCGGKEKYVV